MRPRLSVRVWLTLWNIAVVGVALMLFGIALRFGVHRILIGTVDHDLVMRLNRDMDRGDRMHRRRLQENPDAPRGPDNDPENPGPDGANPPERGSGIAGRPQARDGSPPLGGAGLEPRALRVVNGGLAPQDKTAFSLDGVLRAVQTGQDQFTTATASDGATIRVLSRVAHPPGSNGPDDELVIQMPTAIDFITVADQSVTTTLLLLIPAALVLTGVGGLLLTNRALRPVDDLGRLIGRIQAQNLKERLPDAGSNDEFGRLSGVVNAMLARLEDAFERQRRFAADASHELRTPLATIRASSSLALDPSMPAVAFTPEQYRAMLTRIDAAADRATRVTQDLLFLARVGSLPVRRERLSLQGVLAEARTSVLTAAKLAPASDRGPVPEITVDVPEELRVDSDRDHLLRLFINVIDNAARHTPESGRVFVHARAGTGGPGRTSPTGGVTIAIADNGEGIAPEHLARIREPFYRPDNARSRRSGGAGLGLAITQGIIDALGGDLHIDSLVGQGTTVTVTLPDGPKN